MPMGLKVTVSKSAWAKGEETPAVAMPRQEATGAVMRRRHSADALSQGPRRLLPARSIGTWSAVVGTSRSKIVDLLVANAANVLAVTGAVLLLAATSVPLAISGAVLAGLALGAVAWLLRRQTVRLDSLLAAYTGVRLVLFVGVAGAYVQRRPDDVSWVWLATGLAVLAVLSEPALVVLLSKAEPTAVNLPGVDPVPRPPYSPDVLPLVTLAEASLGAVFAVLKAPGWTYLAVVLTGSLAVVIMVGHALRANLVRRASLTAVPAAVTAYRPAFAVYYGAVHGARYQLGMWLPYLERLDLPFVVFTRAAETVPTIAALTKAPVVVPQRNSALAGLDKLVVGSMTTAFYVQGSRSNLGLQRFRRLTHVWLNHGDGDKLANYSGRHTSYDKVFVAGQQGVDRYAAHGIRMPKGRLVIVGRPQIDKIAVREQPLPPGAPRTVLYAPTWRGGRPATDYSSLALGEQIVAGLLRRDATVIFRPHPLSHADPADARLIRQIQRRLAQDRRTTGRQHVWGRHAEQTWDITTCINASDALVTDVSSVASDNLASGKPFALVAMRSSGEDFRREFPIARVAYVVERDLSTLDAALDQLYGADPLAEERWAYRRYCLGDHLGSHAADTFVRVAGQVVARRRSR